MTADRWGERAAAAEQAVVGRHLRRLWAIRGTALGVNSAPASPRHRLFLSWNYWWQAHLLDCLIDAEIRDPGPGRRRLISDLIRALHIRNIGRWTNAYYDDMAWLALALQRADRQLGTDHGTAIGQLTGEILGAWSAAQGGGIPWRRGDVFKNTPANGPAAILLARCGHLDRAAATADWIDGNLRDPTTGLIWDGLRPGPDGRTQYETTIYPYCQGVVLGAEWELAGRVAEHRAESGRRIRRLVTAIAAGLTSAGELTGRGGGDAGLFTGILARYLALVAGGVPADEPADERVNAAAGRTATALILRSADAAWATATFDGAGLPIFGPDRSRPAEPPGRRSATPARDLSVQLSGWMMMEAARTAELGGVG